MKYVSRRPLMRAKKHIPFIVAAIIYALSVVAQAGDSPKYVVYYDARYPVSWMSKAASGEMKELLTTLGFKEMGADEVQKWMKGAVSSGAKGYLLVMSQDVVPDTLVGDAPGIDALFRKYLDEGGSVIWPADVPFYFVGARDGEKEKWDYLGGRGVLGFDTVGNWQGQSESKNTDLGDKWGLKKMWLSVRAVKPADVSQKIALDKDGNVSAWTKEYSKGSPGFIRLWDYGIKNFTDEMGEDLYRVISNNFSDFAGAKKFGGIYLFKPSDYWPLIHREGEKLVREVQVSVFDNASGNKNYKLSISKNDVALQTIPLYQDDRTFYKQNILVPVHYPDQKLRLVSTAADGKETVVDEVFMNDPSFFCEVKWDAMPNRNPVDMGFFLVPGDKVLLGTDQTLQIGISAMFPGDGPGRKLSLKLQVVDKDKNVLSEIGQKAEFVPGEMFHLTLETAKGIVEAGKYQAVFSVSDGSNTVYEEKKWLIVREPKTPPVGFGAYEADISYLGVVPKYDRKTKEWSDLKWNDVWEKGPYYDIVVAFPNGNRFVFWRGSGYVPFWASWANLGLTYEWIESSFGRGGLVDCLEVLQDKECRYSRPRIVSSTPARVVVKWRYAIVDLEYTIADDEWGEETFIFYPDGFGTRTATGHLLPQPNWHESNEMITLTPAGVNPFDILPSKMVTILSPDARKKEIVTYPSPNGKWQENTPAVFRIHVSTRDPNTPIMASRNFEHFVQQYDGWKVDGRYICPSYWGVHWPVTRGFPTTRTAPPRWRENPAHASIITIESSPLNRKPVDRNHEMVTWNWMIGNTDMPDAKLLDYTSNWINPVPLTVKTGGSGGEYDPTQRAYVIDGSKGEMISAVWGGAPDDKIFNPIVVVKNCKVSDPEIYIAGRKLERTEYRFAVERSWTKTDGVLWISMEVPSNATLEIK